MKEKRRNRKHSVAFKTRLVKKYHSQGSLKGLAREHGIVHSLLEKWVRQYERLGAEGLLEQYGRDYGVEIKQEVVQAYLKGDLSLRGCCLKYAIRSESTLLGWIRRYEQSGVESLKQGRGRPRSMKQPKKESRPLTRLEELEKENLYLRAENELLKKLEALIREREAAPQKKRRPSRD